MINRRSLSAFAVCVALSSTGFAQNRPKAFVTNYTSPTVTVIDTATRAVTGSASTMPNVNAPSESALSPDGTTLYVVGTTSGDVAIIDTTTNSLLAAIPIAASAQFVAYHPDGTRVYVTTNAGSVLVISTVTRTITATITVGSAPRGVAVTPDGSKVYVANSGGNSVSVINTATNTVATTIAVGSAPTDIAINPSGSRLYAANRAGNSVSVINTATDTVVSTIAVGSTPFGVAVSPSGTRVYVANTFSNDVSVIDATTNTVIATVAAGNRPIGIAVTLDGAHVYAGNVLGNDISVIDTVSNTLLTTISSITAPQSIVIGSVPPGTIRIRETTLPDGTAGVNYSQTLTTAGNTGVCTFAITAGSLPPGVTLSNGGVLSGAPTADGAFTFTVIATDPTPAPGNATSGSQSYTLNVSPASIAISPVTLAAPIAEAAYSQTITATRGTAPFTFAITAGSLPAGLTLSPGGVISGTSTASGTFNFTIGVTDSSGGTGPFTASRSYSLIAYPAQYGVFAYVGTSNGMLSVIRTTTNTVTGAITLVPGGGAAAVYAVTASPDGRKVYAGRGDDKVLAVDTPLSTAGSAIPFSFSQGAVVSPDGSRLYVAGSSRSVAVIDTSTWTLLATIDLTTGGSSPRGISITPDGTKLYVACSGSNVVKIISTATNTVTATITVGSSPFDTIVTPDGSRVYVTNLGSDSVSIINTATNTVTGTIAVNRQPHSVALTPDGSKLFVSSQNSGGSGYVSFIDTATNSVTRVLGAGTLTHGLAITPDGSRLYATNVISNNVTVIDVDAGSVLTTLAMPAQPEGVAIAAVPPPSISLSALSPETVGVASVQSVTGSGGTAPYTFAVTAGALPPGLSLAANGAFVGTPTGGGIYNFTITTTDGNNITGPYTASKSYSLTVNPAIIVLAPAALPAATVGSPYSQNIVASAGTAPYGYAMTGGALPAGMSFTAAGVLSGTPTAGGTFNFTITTTDGSSGTGPYSASRLYTLTVDPPAIVLSSSLTPATVGSAYVVSVAASAGTAPYSYAVTAGSLPGGLSLSSAGTLSGTATDGGTFDFTISATDSSGGTGPYTGSQAYSFVVNAPAIAVTPTTLPSGTVAMSYAQSVDASGGTAPYSFAVTSGALPAGMTLSSAGSLAGTPTAGGAFNFTVTATDSSGGSGPFTGSRAYALTIDPPAIVVAPATLPAAQVGVAYLQNIGGSGGVAPYTFAVTGGALPAGVALASDGTLSGTPTAGGSFNFTVTATDSATGSGPFTGSTAYTLVVNAPVITVSPSTLPPAIFGAPYSESVTASGGTSPYAFAVTAGTLPAGLTLSSSGLLTGTPSAGGAFNVTITATDSSGGSGPFSASRAYSDSVGQSVSATTITSSVNPSAFGSPVTFTATVTSGATGTVTFQDGAMILGTASLSGNVATFTTSSLITGAHAITGVYSGDSNYLASTSAPLAQMVDRAATATTLTSNLNPSVAGTAVTFVATVTPGATGTVELYDGATLIATGALAGTTATFTTSALGGGVHAITAVYAGDASYAGSTSAPLSQTVDPAATAVVLTAPAGPSVFGVSITFTAIVPAGATGTVTFHDGSTALGTATIASGVATFTTSSLAVGSHSLTAAYGGDPDHAAATSPAITYVVDAISTATVLSSSRNPQSAGLSVTFTAAVSPAASGTVEFYDGTSLIGTGVLDGASRATFATTSLTAGTHTITAVYTGDATHLGSTSAAVSQSIADTPINVPALDDTLILLLGAMLAAIAAWRIRIV